MNILSRATRMYRHDQLQMGSPQCQPGATPLRQQHEARRARLLQADQGADDRDSRPGRVEPRAGELAGLRFQLNRDGYVLESRHGVRQEVVFGADGSLEIVSASQLANGPGRLCVDRLDAHDRLERYQLWFNVPQGLEEVYQPSFRVTG